MVVVCEGVGEVVVVCEGVGEVEVVGVGVDVGEAVPQPAAEPTPGVKPVPDGQRRGLVALKGKKKAWGHCRHATLPVAFEKVPAAQGSGAVEEGGQ